MNIIEHHDGESAVHILLEEAAYSIRAQPVAAQITKNEEKTLNFNWQTPSLTLRLIPHSPGKNTHKLTLKVSIQRRGTYTQVESQSFLLFQWGRCTKPKVCIGLRLLSRV